MLDCDFMCKAGGGEMRLSATALRAVAISLLIAGGCVKSRPPQAGLMPAAIETNRIAAEIFGEASAPEPSAKT